MDGLTIEKFCFISSLGFLGLVMISSNADATSIQQAMISPSGFKAQAFGLVALYLATKMFRAETRHF